MGPISDLGTRNNLCEYLVVAGFCHRIRLGCLILLIAGATTISQKYGATSIPSNLVPSIEYGPSAGALVRGCEEVDFAKRSADW